MNLHRRLGFLLFFALASLCVISPVAAQETGELGGYVFDADSGLPLEGASLRVDGEAGAITGADGAFGFELPEGEHQVEISAEGQGWTPLGQPVYVAPGEVSEVLVNYSPLNGTLAGVDIEQPEPRAKQATIEDAPPGRIVGTVVSLEDSKPIEGARVFARGTLAEAQTDAEGKFELSLPSGLRELSVLHPKFSTQSVPGVQVPAGGEVEITVELAPAAAMLGKVAVTTPHVAGGTASFMNERRETTGVADLLSAEQMSRAGDSDAAAALRRVTGITIIDGKFVIIRGLPDRYSSTILNGANLPSPEPERRVIPLDVFPVGLLEGIEVRKTWMPDMPGAFGGGSVELRTRGMPEEFTLKMGASVGYRDGTTFSNGLKTPSEGLDFLGFGSGGRELSFLPGEEIVPGSSLSTGGFTDAELETLGEAVPQKWATRPGTVPADFGLSFEVGDRTKIGGVPVGYLLAMEYGNSWSDIEKELDVLRVGNMNMLSVRNDYDFQTTTNTVNLGVVFDLGIEPSEDDKFEFITTLVRSTDSEGRIYQGRNDDVTTTIRVERQRYIERQLLAQQFTGEHRFGEDDEWGVDYRYTFALATRDEPNRRESRYDFENGNQQFELSDRPEGNQIVESLLDDTTHDMALELTAPLPSWEEKLEQQLIVGGQYLLKSREVDTRRFKYVQAGPIGFDPNNLSLPIDQIFNPNTIDPNGFQFEEVTRGTDFYTGDQTVFAGFALAELELLKEEAWAHSLQFDFGFRYESSKQQVDTLNPFNVSATVQSAVVDKADILPGAQVSWEFIEDWFAKLAFSQTVNRPEFRELSPATFNDVTGGRQVFGTPTLRRAKITHVDLRMEWFPSPDEVISIGAFAKFFDDPIERQVILSAQYSVTFVNAPSATNFGVELEVRKRLWPRDLLLALNFALIQSEVDIPPGGATTSLNRALQGQSPWIANAQFGYDNSEGDFLMLVYNAYGERISEVGGGGAPDAFEEPFHEVSIIGGYQINEHFGIKAKAQNLLDDEVEFTQGGQTVESYRKGRKFSLSASAKW